MKQIIFDFDTVEITTEGDVQVNEVGTAGFAILMSAVENQIRLEGWESAEGALEQITNSMWEVFHEGKANWETRHEH